MKNWKRLLSVLLALVLVGTMVSGLALAEEKKKVANPIKSIKIEEGQEKQTFTVGETERDLSDYLTVEYENPTIDPEKEEYKNDEIEWTSSDTATVTVDKWGYIVGRKAGKASVTAASKMKPAIKVTFEVEVKEPPKATSITFNSASFELAVNESLHLNWFWKIHPQNAVWDRLIVQSSEPEIVSVDGYTIYGEKAGNATVTVTITNRDSSTVSASVAITVTEKKVTAISFSKPSITVDLAQKDYVLLDDYITVTPANADKAWLRIESSNEEVVSVGWIEDYGFCAWPHKAGKATVNLRSVFDATIEANMEIIVVEATSISEIKFPIKTMTLYYVAKAGKLVDSANSASIELIVQPELAHVESIQWTTTNANVAIPHPNSTKSYGATIEAVGKGTCVISAYVSDGKNEYSASFKVKVVEKTPTAKLSKKNVTLKVGEKLTLKATDARSKAALKGKWSSSDPSVAKVNKKGVVKAKGPGRAVITFKPETKGMKPVTCVIKVTK